MLSNKNTLDFKSKVYVGKRKHSVCRLSLGKSLNNIIVNKIEFDKYFYESEIYFKTKLNKLLDLFNLRKSLFFSCNVYGGGKNSQLDSILYALAKFLRSKVENEFVDDELTRKKMLIMLRRTGYITVDTRKNEPKKYGHIKSRAKEQFVRR